MGDDNLQIRIETAADLEAVENTKRQFEQLRKQVADNSPEAKKLEAAISDLDVAMSDATASAIRQTQALESNARTSEEALASMRVAIDIANDSTKKASDESDRYTKTLSAMAEQSSGAKDETERLEAALKSLAERQSEQSGLSAGAIKNKENAEWIAGLKERREALENLAKPSSGSQINVKDVADLQGIEDTKWQLEQLRKQFSDTSPEAKQLERSMSELDAVLHSNTASLIRQKAGLENLIKSQKDLGLSTSQADQMLANVNSQLGAGEKQGFKLSEVTHVMHGRFRALHMAVHELGREIPGVNEGMRLLHVGLGAGAGTAGVIGLILLASTAIAKGIESLKEWKKAFEDMPKPMGDFRDVIEEWRNGIRDAQSDWNSFIREVMDGSKQIKTASELIKGYEEIRSTRRTAEDTLDNEEKELEIERTKLLYRNDEVKLAEALIAIETAHAQRQAKRAIDEANHKLAVLKATAAANFDEAAGIGKEMMAAEQTYAKTHAATKAKAKMPEKYEEELKGFEEQIKHATEFLKEQGFSSEQIEKMHDIIVAEKHGEKPKADAVTTQMALTTRPAVLQNAYEMMRTTVDTEEAAKRAKKNVETSKEKAAEAQEVDKQQKERLERLRERFRAADDAVTKANKEYDVEFVKLTTETNSKLISTTNATIKALLKRMEDAIKEREEASKSGESDQGLKTRDVEIVSLKQRLAYFQRMPYPNVTLSPQAGPTATAFAGETHMPGGVVPERTDKRLPEIDRGWEQLMQKSSMTLDKTLRGIDHIGETLSTILTSQAALEAQLSRIQAQRASDIRR